MTRKLTTLAVALAVIGIRPLFASPIEWPVSSGGNGHSYELVAAPGGIDWTQARDAAAAKGGYLACIASAAENDFVLNNVANNAAYWNSIWGPWLGGYQYDKVAEPDGHWAWITGEPWGYTSWASSEPNNSGNMEDRLHYFSYSGSPGPTWNDESQFSTMPPSYVVEYNPVPEPSTFVLLGMGAIGLLGFAWRRRKRLTARQILPLAVVLACSGAGPLAAAPIQWPVSSGGNDHRYEAVSVGNPISWTQARTAAEQAGGHLATLTSEAENLFVFHLIEAPLYWRGYQAAMPLASGPWIGGFQLAGAPEPGGGWQWVTGDPVVYASWCPNSYGGSEPNDDVGNEDCMQFFQWGSSVPAPWWNDARDSASFPPTAYVVEYDAVPEPSAFVLLGMGAVGLLGFAWRGRKRKAMA